MNSYETSVKCFVINLPSDSLRRTSISAQLESMHLPFSVFNAIDGSKLSEEQLQQVYDRSKAIEESHDLTLGEIGCALSHLGVYRIIVERSISHALILEDDAELTDTVPDVLCRLQRRYSSDVAMVVLLHYVEKYKNLNVQNLGDRHYLVDTYGGTPNAHGYFITLAAARNLAAGIYPIRFVADRWDIFSREKLINFKAIVPFCIGLSEHAKRSNLTAERVSRMTLYKKGGLYYYVHRFIYKKFIYQLFMRPFQRVKTQRKVW